MQHNIIFKLKSTYEKSSQYARWQYLWKQNCLLLRFICLGIALCFAHSRDSKDPAVSLLKQELKLILQAIHSSVNSKHLKSKIWPTWKGNSINIYTLKKEALERQLLGLFLPLTCTFPKEEEHLNLIRGNYVLNKRRSELNKECFIHLYFIFQVLVKGIVINQKVPFKKY